MAPFPDKLMGWVVLRMDQQLLAQVLGAQNSGLARTMPLSQVRLTSLYHPATSHQVSFWRGWLGY
jgi:hypothetical protein